VFALFCIVPSAFMYASLCICRLIINYLTSCLSFCAQAPGAPSPVEAIAVLDMSAAVADRAPVPSFPCAQAAAGVFLDIEAIIISPNIPDPADAAPVPSFTCAQAAAGVPPCVEAIIISANIPDPADAAPAAEPAKPFELSLELLSANTAALHAAEKARCLATLPPAAPMTSDTLSAAQLLKNREDRDAALATLRAAKAGQPSVTPEERAEWLAKAAALRRAAAAPQVKNKAEAQRFAAESAAQQLADVLDVHCCNMSEDEQWAAYEASKHVAK
jgi:hypothetical protein